MARSSPAIPTTPAEVIDVLGGPLKVSEAIKRSKITVGSWKFRNKISDDAWPALEGLATVLGVPGITCQTLAEMHHGKPAEVLKALAEREGAAA